MKRIFLLATGLFLLFQSSLVFAYPTAKVGLYVQWYEIGSNGDLDINHQGYFRRARAHIAGSFSDRVTYMVEYDAAFRGNWKNVWILYLDDGNSFRLGQFKVPFGSDYVQSSSYNWFNELALPALTFNPDYRRGAAYGFLQPHWNLSASIFVPGTQTQVGIKRPLGSTQRLIYIPRNQVGRISMFVIANWYQKNPQTDEISFGTIPEASGYIKIKSVDTGTIRFADYFDSLVAEWLFSYDRFASDMAFFYNITPREGNPTLYFTGWYAQFSYFLNNTTLNFTPSEGIFDGPTNLHLSWQCVFRLSEVDLNDRDIHGGREFDTSAGINVYFLNIFKIGFNYIYANVQASQNTPNGHSNIYLLKTQVSF